jgi:hypothetical protein
MTTFCDSRMRDGKAGAAFPGVIFILPSTSVGDAVRGITLLASVLDAGDVENWIEWIQ